MYSKCVILFSMFPLIVCIKNHAPLHGTSNKNEMDIEQNPSTKDFKTFHTFFLLPYSQ